jgi:hypothetical protein
VFPSRQRAATCPAARQPPAQARPSPKVGIPRCLGEFWPRDALARRHSAPRTRVPPMRVRRGLRVHSAPTYAPCVHCRVRQSLPGPRVGAGDVFHLPACAARTVLHCAASLDIAANSHTELVSVEWNIQATNRPIVACLKVDRSAGEDRIRTRRRQLDRTGKTEHEMTVAWVDGQGDGRPGSGDHLSHSGDRSVLAGLHVTDLDARTPYRTSESVKEATWHGRTQPERVAEVHRIAFREPVQIQPTGQPDQVLLRESPQYLERGSSLVALSKVLKCRR